MYDLLALIALVLAIALWKLVSKPFIKKIGEPTNLHIGNLLVGVFKDFIRALIFGFSCDKKIPIGVWFHGLFIISSIIFFITARSSE